MAVKRGQVTLSLVLVVAVVLVVVVGVLRLAQMRSVPLGAARAAPTQGAGPATVELSADAADHAAAATVRDLLTRHFDAINEKDYRAWASTVVPARVTGQPEPAWTDAYDSTQDGTIRVSRIDEQGPNRLIALVSFTSTQDPASGPDRFKLPQLCWRVAFQLVGNPPLIDVSRIGSQLLGPCS